MKKELKIRRLLGNNYHLWIDLKEDGTCKWELYRRYSDKDLYFSKFNKAIMTSEDSTENDLLKFAKKNREYDYSEIEGRVDFAISLIMCILAVINLFLKSHTMAIIIISTSIHIFIKSLIRMDVNGKKFNNRMKRLKEEAIIQLQVLEDGKNNK